MLLLPDCEPPFSLHISPRHRSYLGWKQLASVHSNRLSAINEIHREHPELQRETLHALDTAGHELLDMCAVCPLFGEHQVETPDGFRAIECRGFEDLDTHPAYIAIPIMVSLTALVIAYERDKDAQDPVPDRMLTLPSVSEDQKGVCGLAVRQMFGTMPAE